MIRQGNRVESHCLPLARHERFAFACGPTLACFNACCRDLSQALSPYDVLRLTRHLRLDSAEFRQRYGSLHAGPGSGLPVMSLRPAAGAERLCPFVGAAGCRVYPDRPASCRLYPLARLVRRPSPSAPVQEEFLLLRETHCQGFGQPRQQDAHEWIESQALAPYNEFSDRLFALICARNRLPGALTPRQSEACALALYDLDTLRRQLREGRPPAGLPADTRLQRAADATDAELLAAALAWVQRVVLGAGGQGSP
jgi:hypothetical protein